MLTTLDVSSNRLTTLPLSVSSSTSSSPNLVASFFSPPTIERASKPLPSLRHLLAADNKLVASNIPVAGLPPDLSKCDLGNNPLGMAKSLVHALSQLCKLKQVIMQAADIHDDSFASVKGFATLELLDLGKTKVTETVGEIFKGRPVSWEGEEIEGGVRIILGNRIQKEPWEIAAERGRLGRAQPISDSKQMEPLKESWEIDAENGLLTEGGRRRARAAVAQSSSIDPSPPPRSPSSTSQNPSLAPTLTQYCDTALSTLTLPRSLPRAHTRTRSLAPMLGDGSDPTVPAATLPLPIIVSQAFARTLRVLVLSNRRLDPSFVLPTNLVESEPLLPSLEELRLNCCSLCDSVPVSVSEDSTSSRKEPIFNILASLFPSLISLDLSDNKLTSLSGVRALLIPDLARKTKGLKTLQVRGNKINDLMGLEAVAQVLKSEGRVEAWRLEELDLRDNEIAKLPPMLGYLPLDVLLVEGNTFRVPARRVWEREGSNFLFMVSHGWYSSETRQVPRGCCPG
jgi:Leucine-rich repeat (LRR) protein